MSFHDTATGSLIEDDGLYSDSRRVTTTVDWGDGFATLVHSPDPENGTSSASEEITEELWPEGPPPADERGA